VKNISPVASVNNTEPNELWARLAGAAGIHLSAEQEALLHRYLDLLESANQKMNLTRIVDRASAEILHIGDSLTLLPFLPQGAISIADVGSGGGTPAIPLAIVRSDAKVTCIEATGKKARFLAETAATLGLSNVRVIADRSEEVGRGELRQNFDVAVARALGTMAWVCEYCLPLVKIGGKLLAMKGPKAVEELAKVGGVISRLGGGKVVVHPTVLPGTGGHVIVEIGKVKATDPALPRMASATKGKPLR
jgi:16S rRNA (guanine527-N7)-methyltransferase